MAKDKVKRKLSAILCADVVGYSRLMGEDEEATLAALKNVTTEVIEPVVREHGGRIFKQMGDGFFVEFSSAVDSVECAIEWQKKIKVQEHSLQFRIGINLGDVIAEDDDMYGDGVNIAARIEKLADPGGICISRGIFEQVKRKINLGYQYLGEQEVKNIPEPVRIYKLLTKAEDAGKIIGEEEQTLIETPHQKRRKKGFGASLFVLALVVALVLWQVYEFSNTEDSTSIVKEALPLPDRPSIAVLPFRNLSGDQKQDYFCDGLTEDLITALSKIPDLFVIARNSVFTYKDEQVSVKQVAEELGVQYVLEGSVRAIDERVRITIQLVDSEKGEPLWAERYDRNMEDIFAVQDEVTMQVLTALQVKLTEGEKILALTRSTNDINAYLKWVEGRQHFLRINKEDNIIARKLLEEAIALDQGFSSPHVDSAWVNLMDIRFGISKSPKESLAEATLLAERAISLDESSPFGHCVLGAIFTAKRQHDKAIAQGQKAVALSPGDSLAMAHLGRALSYAGEYEESLLWMKKAIRQDPKALNWYSNIVGHNYLFMGRYREALKVLKESHKNNPKDMTAHLRLVAAYYLAGEEAEARAEASKIIEQDPDFSTKSISTWPLKNKSDSDLFADVLKKAGLPE